MVGGRNSSAADSRRKEGTHSGTQKKKKGTTYAFADISLYLTSSRPEERKRKRETRSHDLVPEKRRKERVGRSCLLFSSLRQERKEGKEGRTGGGAPDSKVGADWRGEKGKKKSG